jgi:glycerol-1-phosphate dehydrogenase [NAD(P)+]
MVSIVCDENTHKIAGKLVSEILIDEGLETMEHIIKESSIKEAQRLIEVCAKQKVGLVVAVGGGSVIDVAKYAGSQLNIPFVSVPTAVSHDGIASPTASLTGAKHKESLPARAPFAIVADLGIIKESPLRFTISGCADVLSNQSAVLDWELAERIKGEAVDKTAKGLALLAHQLVYNNVDTIVHQETIGFELLVKAIINSSLSMCVAGSSRPASGAEHLISHALDRTSENTLLHGLQVGLTSILTLYLHNAEWQEFKNTLQRLGAPTTLKETNFDLEEFVNAMCMAHSIRPNRYTILGESGISRKAAERALVETGII